MCFTKYFPWLSQSLPISCSLASSWGDTCHCCHCQVSTWATNARWLCYCHNWNGGCQRQWSRGSSNQRALSLVIAKAAGANSADIAPLPILTRVFMATIASQDLFMSVRAGINNPRGRHCIVVGFLFSISGTACSLQTLLENFDFLLEMSSLLGLSLVLVLTIALVGCFTSL